MQTVYPLTFRPIFKNYPWGGRNLATRLGRALPAGRVAESWEISAHPNGPTQVIHGAHAGRTLDRVFAEAGEALVGRRNREAIAGGRFPLLIKLLDAHQWLSVQVHPDDAYARARHDDQGKTEMWIVLHADPGAELLLGFRPGVDEAELRDALDAGEIERCLHRVAARAGDAFFVPPGTIHALGPGLLIAEIQQSSDLTFRLYDWERSTAGDGASRPLHIAEALEVLDYTLVAPGPVAPPTHRRGAAAVEELARCRHFAVERYALPAGASWQGTCDGSTFEIWGALEGAARIESGPGSEALDAVTWVLLPAALGRFTIAATGRGARLVRAFTPPLSD